MKKRIAAWILACLMLGCICLPAAAESAGEGEIRVPEIKNMYQFDIPDNEAMAFLKNMGVGWNLGNTFDAHRDGYITNDLSIETAWVGVRTSEKLIATVHDAGYNTLRLPVSWHNHVSKDDFTINKPWLDRVQEVMDYAISRGMYVILNIHHDDGKEYYYPSSACYDQTARYITAIWTQLAERFRDYDEHLIFECINEPRLKGTDNEWWFDANSAACVDAADCINRLNQLFVDTVRASGGNNAARYLMVPGYDAAPGSTVNGYFTLPQDEADNRIIVSVHAYTPYAFALQDGGSSTFKPSTTTQSAEIQQFLTALYRTYISQGIPVVIGEFGARDKKGNLQERVNYAAYYTASASARNIPCCWWDNGAFYGTGELFGLIRRDTCVWKYPEIVEAMMQYAGYDKIPVRE